MKSSYNNEDSDRIITFENTLRSFLQHIFVDVRITEFAWLKERQTMAERPRGNRHEKTSNTQRHRRPQVRLFHKANNSYVYGSANSVQ